MTSLETRDVTQYAQVICPQCRPDAAVWTGRGVEAILEAHRVARDHAMADPGHKPRVTAVYSATFFQVR